MRAVILASAMFLCAAGAASAQVSIVGSARGYTYFNRAGATIDQHDADVRICRDVLSELSYNRRITNVQGGEPWFAAGHAVSDTLGNVLTRRRAYAANFENCMVVRGWRVVRADDATGASLDAMAAPALREALAPLVGAAEPNGEIARVFGNDMQAASTTWTGAPGDLDRVSLSLQTGSASEDDEGRAAPATQQRRRAPNTARPPNGLSARAASRLPADATVVVLRIDSNFRLATTSLRFDRISANAAEPAWVSDGLPASFQATLGSLGGAGDQTFIFQIPPGHWRITSLTQNGGMDDATYETNFCLGSPSFEITTGQALYLGAFHLRTAAFGPDLAMSAIQGELTDAPALADRLQPAVYLNGSTAGCSGSYIYAVEAPGAQFDVDYALGSRAAGR